VQGCALAVTAQVTAPSPLTCSPGSKGCGTLCQPVRWMRSPEWLLPRRQRHTGTMDCQGLGPLPTPGAARQLLRQGHLLSSCWQMLATATALAPAPALGAGGWVARAPGWAQAVDPSLGADGSNYTMTTAAWQRLRGGRAGSCTPHDAAVRVENELPVAGCSGCCLWRADQAPWAPAMARSVFTACTLRSRTTTSSGTGWFWNHCATRVGRMRSGCLQAFARSGVEMARNAMQRWQAARAGPGPHLGVDGTQMHLPLLLRQRSCSSSPSASEIAAGSPRARKTRWGTAAVFKQRRRGCANGRERPRVGPTWKVWSQLLR
jgi:hypothetical protein